LVSVVGDPTSEECHGDQYADAYADGEVVGGDGDGNGGEHDHRLGFGHPAQGGGVDGVPVEGAYRDHDHHGNQGGHRDERDDVAEPDDQDQQEGTGEERGDPGAGPGGLHVDHGLADHGAAAHAAEEAGDDVGRALAERLAGLVGVGVGDVVDELRGQQGFQEADQRHRQRVRGDDLEGVQGERQVGQEQGREAIGQFAFVAHVRHVDRGEDGESGERDDGDQRSRDDVVYAGEADNDRDAIRANATTRPARISVRSNLGDLSAVRTVGSGAWDRVALKVGSVRGRQAAP